ncbi:winged helix-turn-helix domain-containing protein [Streptomyces vinaceus]
MSMEDGEAIRRSVALAHPVSTGPEKLSGPEAFREDGHDPLIPDVMPRRLDGVGSSRCGREASRAPISMVSARGDSLGMVSGLEAGADDHVVKPVNTTVLVAGIRMLPRRAEFTTGTVALAAEPGLLTFCDLTVDTLGQEARSGELIALTATELFPLWDFEVAPGVALSQRELPHEVWDDGWEGDPRVVGLTVRRLCQETDADQVETVRGHSYRFGR